MKKNAKSPGAAGALPVIEITDLAELEKLTVAEPVVVEVEMSGRKIRLTGRRLRPFEVKEVQLLLERALPPMLPGKDGEPERMDLRDPKYLEEKETCKREARALAIHMGFPVFKEALARQGGVIDKARIVEFIEHRDIDDDHLMALFMALTERRVEAARFVGFTSGNSSRNG